MTNSFLELDWINWKKLRECSWWSIDLIILVFVRTYWNTLKQRTLEWSDRTEQEGILNESFHFFLNRVIHFHDTKRFLWVKISNETEYSRRWCEGFLVINRAGSVSSVAKQNRKLNKLWAYTLKAYKEFPLFKNKENLLVRLKWVCFVSFWNCTLHCILNVTAQLLRLQRDLPP